MAFVLQSQYETVPFEVLFDPSKPQVPPSKAALAEHEDPKGKTKLESIVFHLRCWDGNDGRAIANSLMAGGKDDEAQLRSGDVMMVKVVRGVASVDGLQSADGTRVPKLTETHYGQLPRWITQRVLARLNEINQSGVADDLGALEGN